MANRRMFSLSVVDTDNFLEMPISSRLLYYELGMRADDDGFVDNWKKIIKMSGLTEDDMKVLISKKFIIPFENGIIIIRHWRMNNYLRSDRYIPSIHKEEFSKLNIEDNVYNLETTENSNMLPPGIPMGYPGKERLGKERLGKERLDNSGGTKKFVPPTLSDVENYISSKGLNVSAKEFFDYFDTGNWVDAKGQKVKNWKQKLLTWEKFNKQHQTRDVKRPARFADFLEEEFESDKEGDNQDTGDTTNVVSAILSEYSIE